MKKQLCTYEGQEYIIELATSTDAILQTWPLSEIGEKLFVSPSVLILGEWVEVDEIQQNSPAPKQRPASAQATPKQRPARTQPAPALQTASARAAIQEFDELKHYYTHYSVIEVMQNPACYEDSKTVECFNDLEQVSKFPRPVCRNLNQLLGWNRNRDYYMNLYRIHCLVEAQKPVWLVARFEEIMIGFLQKYLT